jgi:oligopeptide transport system substrate-binding protein
MINTIVGGWFDLRGLVFLSAALLSIAMGSSRLGEYPVRDRARALPDADFVVAIGEPISLDPVKITGGDEHRAFEALFEGLTVYDPRTGMSAPGVAESWVTDKSSTKWTFKIRKDARWSDGVPITAQTVVASWLRELDPEEMGEYAYMLTDFIRGAAEYNSGEGTPEDVAIKALDASTFVVELLGPTPFFPEVVAHFAYAIVPMHAIQKYGEGWTHPDRFVGNGPYVLRNWYPREHLFVERNPLYWDARNVHLESIAFITEAYDDSMLDLFKSGYVDWVASIPSYQLPSLREDPAFVRTVEYATYYLIFNVTKAPFDDVRVRKALAMAIDKDALVKEVLDGMAVPTDSLVPSSTGYDAVEGNAFNVRAAKAMLAEAGFAAGKGFPEVVLLYPVSERHKAVCEFVIHQWKALLGIDVSLTEREYRLYLADRQRTHDFQIARAGWIADYVDPTTFLHMFRSSSGNNDGLYRNDAYDSLLRTADGKKGQARFDALREAERMLIERDQAVIPLYHYERFDLIDLAEWDGWYPNPMGVHPWKGIKRRP